PHEIPQPFLHAKDLSAGPGRRRAATPRPVLQGAANPGPQAEDPLLEGPLLRRAVPRLVPRPEQPVRQPEQAAADPLPGAASVDHRLEIAARMAPADLPPVGP